MGSLNISKFLGDNSYRILIASGLFGIFNLPIQAVQLFLLGKLNFPTITIFQLPWYITIGCGIGLGLFCLWLAGYVMEYFDVPKHQNAISNKNNLEISEILERLERIERKLDE
jgi:hypothetical protein